MKEYDLERLDTRSVCCMFGPEFFRGMKWGAAVTFLVAVAGIRGVNSALRTMAATASKTINHNRAIVERGLYQGARQKLCDPQNFQQKENTIKRTFSSYQVSPYLALGKWALYFLAAMKAGMFFVARGRYNEFAWEAEMAREVASSEEKASLAELEELIAARKLQDESAREVNGVQVVEMTPSFFDGVLVGVYGGIHDAVRPKGTVESYCWF